MRVLLHACCAPCSLKCVETLRQEDVAPVLFWYNPNIHPFTEYQNRMDALRAFAGDETLDVVWDKAAYGLRPFLAAVGQELDARCEICYRTRMNATARYASENGFDGYSTTLLISPYQKHERIRELAEQASRIYGTPFIYRDFRPLFRAGQQAARDRGLYRQKYCGCVFSEEERYSVDIAPQKDLGIHSLDLTEG